MVVVSDMDDNVFLFKFHSEDDVKQVLNGAPWTIMANHLLLKRWDRTPQLRTSTLRTRAFGSNALGFPERAKSSQLW